jgi:regulator of replication initiation timing
MTTPKLARHIAKRLDSTSDAASQNAADTLRSLADQVDALNRGMELINSECIRLAKERDELRLELTELKSRQMDRRAEQRN